MTPTPVVIDGIILSQQEQLLFAAHNQRRNSQAIPVLSLDPTLMAIARERAQIMADTGVFSHYGPDGATVFDLMADADYVFGDATENIHYNNVNLGGAVGFAMSEFDRSPPHRANILSPGFHRIGIGFQTSASGIHYISVVFSD
jgi:uncharacterized protein YkwD